MNYKYTLSMLAVGVLMAACSNELPDSPQTDDSTYINFGVPTTTVVDSRATETLPEGVTQGSTLLNGIVPNTSFGVLGCCLAYQPGTQDFDYVSGPSPWSVKRPNANLDVFKEQKVDYDGTNCKYTYTDNAPRKWYSTVDGIPESDIDLCQYTFFSYYPYKSFEVLTRKYQLKGGTTVDIPAPIFKYSMPFTNQDTIKVLEQKDVKDVMLDAVYNAKKGSKVQFDFTHMLTALSFTVNNYSDNTSLTVYKIELSGEFWKSITVDLTQASASYSFEDSYKGRFVIYDSETGIEIPSNNANFKPAFADQYMLLISGQNTGLGYLGKAKVSITYKFGKEEKKTAWFTRPATFVPRPGTMYQAQLNFVGNAFVLQFVTANSDNWEDGSNSDLTFQ